MTTLTTAQCESLESLLSDLEAHARASATLADEHRTAVSTADPAALARCVAAQQQSASELLTLETRRAAFLRSLGLRNTAGATLTQIAALAPASKAPALTAAVARVRHLLSEAAERRETVRLASLSLMAHMQGLLGQIGRHLSDTKTYAHPHRSGRSASLATATNAGTLDFTS